MIKASLIILNYNGAGYIQECINSVLLQTYQDFEIILADNNSKDKSVEIVEKFFQKEIKLQKLKVVKFDKNYGFAGGNNRAVKYASGEYIVLLNDDTVVDKYWLENLVKGVAQNQKIGIVASKILFYDNHNLIDSAGDGLGIDGVGFKRGHLESSKLYDTDEYIFGACGAGVLYKKELWEKLGGFDEDFFAVHEDTDFNFRAQLLGYKCLYKSNAIVYHKVNSSIGKYSYNYVLWTHRNNEYVYLKNMPLGLILKYFCFHLMYDILSFFYFSFKGQSKAFFDAKLEVLKNISFVLNKRRTVQQKKVVTNRYLSNLMVKNWLKARIKK